VHTDPTDNQDVAAPGESANLSTFRASVVKELEALEEDLLWTEKAHFARAEHLSQVNLWVGLIATTSACISAATIVAHISPLVPGIFALTAAISSGLLTFLKPLDAERRHLDAGRRLGALRVQVRQAIRLDSSPIQTPDVNQLRELARQFAEEKAKIDHESPGTSGLTFNTARKKIEAGHFQHAGETQASADRRSVGR